MKTKIIDGYEYDCETSQKGKRFEELEIPEGSELWEVSDFEKFSVEDWKDLGLRDDWFFIKQFSKYWGEKGKIARFVASSVWAGMSCDGNPNYPDDSLGVRMKRRS